MEKNIKIVIGANYGDEGKGLMTDYFCHELSKNGPVLNVRYNGGAQAGHTVVTPDGKRHVFKHFGAGSFNKNVVTLLSDDFIVNPMLFCKEWDEFTQKFGIEPEVYISPNCRITTPYDMFINQMLEIFRGENRHGSCGLGIYETVQRNQISELYLMVSDLSAGNLSIETILRLIQQRYVPSRLASLHIYDPGLILPERTFPNYCDWIRSEDILQHFIADCEKMMSHCQVVDTKDLLKEYDNIVFEGAQGLLLDERNMESYPHVTASRTGVESPARYISLIDPMKKLAPEVCYVTRSYLTRHGAGPFKTECEKGLIIPNHIQDKTNQQNEYQGKLRYGFFDELFFSRTILKDVKDDFGMNNKIVRSIAVTHLDETGGMIVRKNGNIRPEDLCKGLSETLYKSFGETRNDISTVE